MDYYVPNDFTDWRYQQLVRPEHDAIDYARVQSLLLYYNGLPGKSTVACGIDDVKALRSLDARELVDPYIEVAGSGSPGRDDWRRDNTSRSGLASRSVAMVCRWSSRKSDRSSPTGRHCRRAITPPASASAGGPAMPLRVRVTLQPPERHPVP